MELIGLILLKLQMLPDIVCVIMIGATIVSKLTPSKSDDEKVAVINSKLQKFISFLPTLGIDKRTMALEEAYKKLSEEMPKEEPNK